MAFNGFGNYIQDGFKDIGQFEGLDPPSINLYQKYIHRGLCTRAVLPGFKGSDFTGILVDIRIKNENSPESS